MKVIDMKVDQARGCSSHLHNVIAKLEAQRTSLINYCGSMDPLWISDSAGEFKREHDIMMAEFSVKIEALRRCVGHLDACITGYIEVSEHLT
jgi:hypothetical protein